MRVACFVLLCVGACLATPIKRFEDEQLEELFKEVESDVENVFRDPAKLKKHQIEAEENIGDTVDGELSEGDIKFTPSQKAQIKALMSGKKPFFDASTSGKWANARVPYKISVCNDQCKTALDAAIAEYNAKTCIRWEVATAADTHYVEIIKGGGCYSYIGNVNFFLSPQPLSIGQGCEYKGTVMHEMMHALGFYHEQSRLDRDDYVTVNFTNIREGMESNFAKYGANDATTHGFPYDKKSIMHYGNYYFAIDYAYKTVTSKSDANEVLGQKDSFTETDIGQLNAHYECSTAPATNAPVATAAPTAAPTEAPAVDGNWGAWTAFAACTATCGGGYQTRTRECNSPAPSNGGAFCNGVSGDTKICFEQECAVNGNWGQWTEYSACTHSCGGGQRTRTRDCNDPKPFAGGLYCDGNGVESGSCGTAACPEEPNNSCKDHLSWCSWLKNYCTGMFGGWTRKNCPKTCGQCDQ